MTQPRAAARALEQRLADLAAAFWIQGVVKPNATEAYVIVEIDGSPIRCPYLQSYTPRAGDIVWLAGPPGSWVCLGTITGGRDATLRDLTVRNLTVTGTSATSGSATVNGNLDVTGYVAKTNGFVMAQTPAGLPNLYSPSADVSLVGSGGALYVANPANTVARAINAANVSERQLKVEHDVVDDGLAKVEHLVPGRWSWADPEARADDSTHVGIYVDELAEVEPDAVRELPTGERAYEPNAVIALLVSAVQDLAGQVRDLQAQLPGSTASREGPPYPDQTGSAVGSDGA